jgi:hypothetical protein
MEGIMARVIEFYIPDSLPQKDDYIARNERGTLIEFPTLKRNQPRRNSAQSEGMCAASIASFGVNFASGRTGDTL